jgi:hypothetical protein
MGEFQFMSSEISTFYRDILSAHINKLATLKKIFDKIVN